MPKSSVLDGREFGYVSQRVSIDSLPYVLKRTSPSAYEVQRIRLGNLKHATLLSKKIQEWCNVVVLQIYECSNLKVLDLHGLNCLRHLELVRLTRLESFHFANVKPHSLEGPTIDKLDSLQHVVLEHLMSLKQLPNFNLCTSLKSLRILDCEEFLLEPPRFMSFLELEYLNLDWNGQWQVEEFKLCTLTSLTSLQLCNQVGISNWSRSFTLKVVGSLTLAGLGNCSRLQILKLVVLPITSLLGLEKLTQLEELFVSVNSFNTSQTCLHWSS